MDEQKPLIDKKAMALIVAIVTAVMSAVTGITINIPDKSDLDKTRLETRIDKLDSKLETSIEKISNKIDKINEYLLIERKK